MLSLIVGQVVGLVLIGIAEGIVLTGVIILLAEKFFFRMHENLPAISPHPSSHSS